MRLRHLVLALAVCTAPAFAITITGTSGCTSSQAGITGTVTYAGQAINDSGGDATYATPYFDQGSPTGCNSDFLGLNGGQSTTITFTEGIDYLGFVWGSPDGYNSVELFNGGTLLAAYSGSVVTNEYMNFFADPGVDFTSVVLSSGSCCFETDNLSYTVDASAPEPATLFAPMFAAGTWFGLRKLRLAARN